MINRTPGKTIIVPSIRQTGQLNKFTVAAYVAVQ